MFFDFKWFFIFILYKLSADKYLSDEEDKNLGRGYLNYIICKNQQETDNFVIIEVKQSSEPDIWHVEQIYSELNTFIERSKVLLNLLD